MSFLNTVIYPLFCRLNLCIFLTLIIPSIGHCQNPITDDSNPPKISKDQALDFFLIEFAMRENLSVELLREAFHDMKWQSVARQYMMPSPNGSSKKNWHAYLSNVMHPSRIAAGKKFLIEHQDFLHHLEKETGVPTAIIVGILGVETIYGKNMGNFPVKDVLATFAFDYPPSPNQISRSAMFKEQLYDHLINCLPLDKNNVQAENLRKCLNQEGSFAGAIGMPQFMPSSIRKYAQDGDGDGEINLRNSPKDAMQSIANFLKMHGWRTGEPITLKIDPIIQHSAALKELADGDPNPKIPLVDLKNKKIIQQIPPNMDESSLALIVDLPSIEKNGETSIEYLVGLNNFEVITQYNRSFFYAMSVAEFGQAVVNTETVKSAKRGKHPSTNNGRRDHKQ
jgi:membrane-bound lytic murein transglycosylase B